MSPTSLTATALPWLAAAWIVTVVVVATLIYLIVHAVLGKTEPQRLPEVICALGPLIKGVAQSLARPIMPLMDREEPIPSTKHGQATGNLNPQLLDSAADDERSFKMVIEQTGVDPVPKIGESS